MEWEGHVKSVLILQIPTVPVYSLVNAPATMHNDLRSAPRTYTMEDEK